MALFNVSTTNNDLTAIGYPAHATSEQIVQDAADTDFESIREARVLWLLNNISDASSTADTLITNADISAGDRILVRKNDGTIINTIANTPTPTSEANIIPAMTNNTSPEGTALTDNNSSTAYRAFDNDSSTYATPSTTGTGWVQYTFKDNTPKTILKYKYKGYSTHSWVIEGSVDGTNFVTISTESNIDSSIDHTYNIESPGAFSTYRLRTTTTDYFRVYTFALLGDGVEIDTSAVTQGEVPDQVFLFTDSISFNGVQAQEKDLYYEYGNNGLKMYALSLYDDVALDGRTLQTRVDFSTSGNVATEITGQIFKDLP